MPKGRTQAVFKVPVVLWAGAVVQVGAAGAALAPSLHWLVGKQGSPRIYGSDAWMHDLYERTLRYFRCFCWFCHKEQSCWESHALPVLRGSSSALRQKPPHAMPAMTRHTAPLWQRAGGGNQPLRGEGRERECHCFWKSNCVKRL